MTDPATLSLPHIEVEGLPIPPGMACSVCRTTKSRGYYQHEVAGYPVHICDECNVAGMEHDRLCAAPDVVPVYNIGTAAPVSYICSNCTWKHETVLTSAHKND